MLNVAELTGKKYRIEDGKKSIALLSQGERDVLEQVRATLGWPSIVSLAFKYYPAYHHRKWWLEALRRTLKWSHKKNIQYILKCLQSINDEWAEAAFNGKAALNRLIHHSKDDNTMGTNRLVGQAGKAGIINISGDILPPVLARVGGAVC